MLSHDDSGELARKKAEFNREAWRAGLEELDPAARAAMAAVSAEKERLKLLEIDRIVAGLGQPQQAEDERR